MSHCKASILPPKCGAMLVRQKGSVHLTDSCVKDTYYFFLCEFDSAGSNRPYTKDAKNVHLVRLQNPQTSFDFSFVECPEKHHTHTFLACDSQSECWSMKVKHAESWNHELTVSASSWCDAPKAVTPEPVHFVCASKIEHVPFTLVCDFLADCFDKSDENFCVHPPCSLDRPVPCGDSKQVNLACCSCWIVIVHLLFSHLC